MPRGQKLGPPLQLGGRIEHLIGVTEGEVLTSVNNGCEAQWATDTLGRHWLWKRTTGFQTVLAEALSFFLGEALGVRQPEVAVYRDPESDQVCWMSGRIEGPGEHWDPSMRDQIENLPEVGAMFALDALVANEDRHNLNILVTRTAIDGPVTLWSIDLGEATVAHISDFAALGTTEPSPRNHARGLPIEVLVPHALAAAQKAEVLTFESIEAWSRAACNLVLEPDAEVLARALFARCQDATSIVSRYVASLGAML